MNMLGHSSDAAIFRSRLTLFHDQFIAGFKLLSPEETHHDLHTRAVHTMTIPSPTHPALPPPAAPQPPSNGMGVTGLVTGIVGACLAWVPIFGFILGVLGIVFGGIGLYYASQGRAANKGTAIAGLVLGIFAVVFWPVLLAIAGAASTSVTP
jgi:hypothetical protein